MTALKATSTNPGQNQFQVKIYLRVREGQLMVVPRKFAAKTCILTLEYPTYGEEIDKKQECTRFDSLNQTYLIQYEELFRWRIQRSLVAWNLQDIYPELQVNQVVRQNNLCTMETMREWMSLPPLLRKAIQDRINLAMGPFS